VQNPTIHSGEPPAASSGCYTTEPHMPARPLFRERSNKKSALKGVEEVSGGVLDGFDYRVRV